MKRLPKPIHVAQSIIDPAALTLLIDAPEDRATRSPDFDATPGIISALRARFSDIQGPNGRDICYATQNRQSAVRDQRQLVDFFLVIKAADSSNSNRLREIRTKVGAASYLIADGSQLPPEGTRHARYRRYGWRFGAGSACKRRD